MTVCSTSDPVLYAAGSEERPLQDMLPEEKGAAAADMPSASDVDVDGRLAGPVPASAPATPPRAASSTNGAAEDLAIGVPITPAPSLAADR